MSSGSEPAIWKRKGRSMVPANESADDMLKSIKPDQEVIGNFHGVRSVKQLRLYWGLMRVLVDQDIFPSLESASIATKIACGHVETAIMPDTGEIAIMPKHINFQSMPPDKFNRFFEVAIHTVVDRWLAGNTYDQVRTEVEKMILPVDRREFYEANNTH